MPYVDSQRGFVSREIFVDDKIYRAEQKNVFCKSWLFIGLASQVPNAGDFFRSRMGEESVVMVRDRAGNINVLLNSCRHRGMKVCRYDDGNSPSLTCPYHGWSYALNGDLMGVPQIKDAYYNELDKSQLGLLKARSFVYRGTVWATWNQDAPAFIDYLGGMQPLLDTLLDPMDGTDGELEMFPGVQRWIVPCNWKFPSENAFDMYHSGPTHISVESVGIGPGGKGQTRHGINFERKSMTSFPGKGHGFRGAPTRRIGYPFTTFQDATVEAYFRGVWERRLKKFPDGLMPTWTWGGGGLVFPNFQFHSRFPWTIMVAHPTGPTTTELWHWFLVEKDMPEEVKLYMRQYVLRYSGPGGMTEQDDLENWNMATAASTGEMARQLPYHIGQGLGHWKDSDTPLEGARYSDQVTSEASALVFYERWQTLMQPDNQGDMHKNNTATVAAE